MKEFSGSQVGRWTWSVVFAVGIIAGAIGCHIFKSPETVVAYMEYRGHSEALYKEDNPGVALYKPGTYKYTADYLGWQTRNRKRIRKSIDDANRAAARRVAAQASKATRRRPKCFTAGTVVHTPEGLRAIETIAVGEMVLSFDEASGKVEAARVTNLVRGEREDLFELRGPEGSLTCSSNHSFYTTRSSWERVEEMGGKAFLVSNGGNGRVRPCLVTVCELRRGEAVPVFNFGVEGNENYFAGPDGILCHNTKGGHKP